MKHLLLLAMLCLLVVGAGATTYNFQNPGDNNSVRIRSFGGGANGYSLQWTESVLGGNNYLTIGSQKGGAGEGYAVLILPSSSPATYAAATYLGYSGASAAAGVALFDGSYNVLYSYHPSGVNATSARYEVKVSGGTAYIYSNGNLVATSGALAQNPSYIGFGTEQNGVGGVYYYTYWDDYVYGSGENKFVLGLPESDDNKFIIMDDIINPANSGLWNTTSNSQSDANYMSGRWSRGNATVGADTQPNQSVQLIGYPSGAVYATNYTVAAYTNAVTINIKTLLIDVNAPDGYYALTIPGTGAYSNPILKRSSGATVTWNADTYFTGDAGTVITYVAAGGYWDPGTYTYKLAVMDVFGGFHGANQTISTQSGSFTHAWSEDDDPGVYYAIVYATDMAGNQYIFGSDWATLESGVGFTGVVSNAQTGAAITGAVVNITQGSTVVNYTTIAGGAYTAPGFITGALLWANVTATGYRPYNYSFTPMAAKGVVLNFSLVPDTPAVTGAAIGGVVHDVVYGRPISSALAQGVNSTATQSNTSTITGYYLLDNVKNLSYYDVHGSKIGYTNSPTYNVSVNGSVSNFTQQDIFMAGQYTQTFTITDASTGAPIPVVNLTDDDSQTYTTSTGTGYLTWDTGVHVAYFTSDGYVSRAISYIVDGDASHAVQLTPTPPPAPEPSQNTWWTPHTVQVTVFDANYGTRLYDVNIQAHYNESSMPTDWVNTLYGVGSTTSAEMVNQTLIMNGNTGSAGTVTFTMLGSIKYDFTLNSAQYGISDYTVMEWPSDNMLNIYVLTAGSLLPTQRNSTYTNLNGTRVYFTEPDINNVSMCMDYIDTSGGTSSVTFLWKFTNGTLLNTSTVNPGTGLNTICNVTRNIRGTQVVWGYNATRNVVTV